MSRSVNYPSNAHARAADAITTYFHQNFEIEAVLLVNSCARGKATRDSCLDMVVMAQPQVLASWLPDWEAEWEAFNETDPVLQALRREGKYSVVHLDLTDGVFAPQERDEAAGPDSFELGIGNFLAYSVPLWSGSDYLAQLKSQWLPYYAEPLRLERLRTVRHYCLNNLHHIPVYVHRGLYFQAFDRLYNATQEFLQALFIARQVYPIAYNMWIHEQIVEILGLPDLYTQLVRLFEIRHFESDEIRQHALTVEALLEEYAPEP